MVKAIVDVNNVEHHIPDYTFELDGDLFIIRPRHDFTEIYGDGKATSISQIHLASHVHEKAKKFLNGWCPYAVESDWRAMLQDKGTAPDNPEGSYIGYAKWYAQKHGSAR